MAEPSSPTFETAFVVSGGVSLGAYEAGFLYYALETVKANPKFTNLRLVTGASAGSINGLLAILSACGPKIDSPTESLFWRTWIPLSLRNLYVPRETSALGVFSRRWFDSPVGGIEEAWKRGLDAKCDVVLGVSTTRLSPRIERTARDRLAMPRIEAKFALRIQGRGFGRPPVITNYLDPGYGLAQDMLVTGPDGAVAFSTLRDLLYASAAFPVAFAPQRLATCSTNPENGGIPECTPETANVASFVDGGVLDNTPLRFAARLAGGGLHREEDGAATWLPSPHFDRFELPEKVRFAFMAPDITDYPSEDLAAGSEAPASAMGLVNQLFGNFVDTARGKELATLVEEHPEIGLRVVLPRRHYPTASGLLRAFFGFFETDFRVFDFYLGMYDARRTFEDDAIPDVSQMDGQRFAFVYPEDVASGRSWGWQRFRCMRGVFDAKPDLRASCEGEDQRNFRALLAVSIERLWDTCVRSTAPTTRRDCLAARHGEPPLAVDSIKATWRRRTGEPELDYVVRLLAQHDFEFRDLGLSREDAALALPRIRRTLGEMAQSVADAQRGGDQALIGLIGRLGADSVSYLPPRHVVYAAMGRELELGWTDAVSELRWIPSAWRFNLALLVDGIPSQLSSDHSYFSFGAAAGVELQPRALSSLLSQSRLVLRAGYLFADGDDFLASSCHDPAHETLGSCSRMVVQGVVGMTLLQRLRVQLLGEWYPSLRHDERMLWSITPAVGIEFAL